MMKQPDNRIKYAVHGRVIGRTVIQHVIKAVDAKEAWARFCACYPKHKCEIKQIGKA